MNEENAISDLLGSIKNPHLISTYLKSNAVSYRLIGAGGRARTYEAREIYSLLSLPLDDSSNLVLMEP